MLAEVVSIANIVQEVKTGTDTADSDRQPSVQLSERTRLRAHPSRCGWNADAPRRFFTSGAVVHKRQRRGIQTTLRLALVANPEVPLCYAYAVAIDAAFADRVALPLLAHGHCQVCAGADFRRALA